MSKKCYSIGQFSSSFENAPGRKTKCHMQQNIEGTVIDSNAINLG